MRHRASHLHRGIIFNYNIPLCLLLFWTVTGSMAWTTMHRSIRQLHWHSSSSLYWFTKQAAGGAFFKANRNTHRAFQRTAVSSSATRLYAYQDFLKQNQNDNILVSYFTDIEGDKFYLDRYVDNSKILTWSEHERTNPDSPLSMYSSEEYTFPYDRKIEFSNSNSILVFGGDLWDKGGFDLYVTRQLLDLKRRHPDRVVWVLGNRDINKLRMTQELGLPTVKPSVPYHPGLTWFRGSGKVGDPDGNLPCYVWAQG